MNVFYILAKFRSP
uniref:Uncharacterized protein n=1 Tax=Rhizophora mucronata TaxID=61149 RepID=A0A2P2NBH4_RHIMU